MYAAFAVDFISLVLLMGAFYLIWKQRSHFHSLRSLLPAIAFVSIGRLCDMLAEHPSIRLSSLSGLAPVSYELLFTVTGNITDAIGISLFIYSFVMIIRYQRSEEKHIQDLETLLPLCSNCRKYRTKDGKWMPIEKYLIESGAPKLTHGICPECATELYGDILKADLPE